MAIASEIPNLQLSSESIRTRFRQALRQGNSQWLWPEISLEGWQTAVCAIDRVVRDVLAGGSIPVLEGNSREIGVAAFTSGMGPLLGFWASTEMLTAHPSLRAVLDLHYSHNLERMQRLARFALTAVEAMSAAGIGVTVLKGMHTAYRFFPKPGCRPMSDIDLLIAPACAQRACRVLEALGYSPAERSYGEQSFRMKGLPAEPPGLSLVHRDGPWSIDLHTTLSRRYSPGAPMVRMDRAVRNADAGAWPLSPCASVLAGEALVVQLACHASTGLASLSLLRLTELVLVIRKLEADDRLSWGRVVQTAGSSGVPACVYPALQMVEQLAPGTVPAGILRQVERSAPAAVRSVMAHLRPATCQRVRRYSFKERFMWTHTKYGWVREIFLTLFPTVPFRQMLKIYARRFFILFRGRLSS
jgi:hypothetical protein